MHIDVEGIYTIRKYNADTGLLVQEVGPFCNMITNIGLNKLATNSPHDHCYVGTGTNPATALDTAMGNRIATTRTVQSNSNNRSVGTPYWAETTRTYRFPAGAAAGNITEVGVGWEPSSVANNYLWSRELTVDSAGSPVTITVLANEFLDVSYTIRYYPSLADFSGSFMLGDVEYSYTGRSAFVTSLTVSTSDTAVGLKPGTAYGGAGCALGPVTDTITGASKSTEMGGTVTYSPYVNNSLKYVVSTSFTLNQANVTGGIKAMTLIPTGAGIVGAIFQLVLNSPIPKDNTRSMTLVTELSWGRYMP